jgi:hypothetical protein
MKFIQKTIFLALILLSAGAVADIEDQIRDHIDNIEAAQKQIASLLVLQNFSRQFIENADLEEFKELYSVYISDDNALDMQKISTALFEVTYSDKLDKEKIVELTQLSILLRGSKYQWINMGENLQQAHQDFFASFANDNQVCSEENFSKSLAMMESFSPAGVDTSQLKRSWQLTVGGKLTVDDDGSTSINYYARPQYPEGDEDSAEMKHAVAVTAGAVATGYGGPYAGAAAMAAVELIWGAFSMAEHMREMEKIAEANEDLHEIMQFEINVRKHFNEYCQHLNSAYQEAQPLVADINNLETRTKIHTELVRLKALLGDDLSHSIIQKQTVYQSPEVFYQFFKFKILNEALILHNYEQDYYGGWSGVIAANRTITTNLENAIYQFIERKIANGYKPDEAVDRLIAEVEQFSKFKSLFYQQVLSYFDEANVDKRNLRIDKLESLITNYRLYHRTLNEEETEFFTLALKTIKELRQKNV